MLSNGINRVFRTAGFLVLVAITSCVPVENGTVVLGPQEPSDMTVTAETDTPTIAPDSAVTLTATAADGTPPYAYRWEQNDGAAELDLSEVELTAATLTIDAIEETGRYVFRVLVTDSDGFTETAFVVVEVQPTMTIEAAVDTGELFEGMSATFTATTDGGTEPIEFAWVQAEDDEEVALEGETTATLTAGPFPAEGVYTFTVTATDDNGVSATTQTAVEVLSAVSIDVPELAVAGEPVEMFVTIETPTEGLTFLWEVTSGTASFDDETAEEPLLTTTADETVTVQLTAAIPTDDGGSITVTREAEIVSVVEEFPRVSVTTSLGSFTVELDREAAPLHTANFLYYADSGFYENTLIHRVACAENEDTGECDPFVIQGGGIERIDGELELKEATRDAVTSEAAEGQTSMALYDVSLALSGSDADSGATQFFVNMKDENDFSSVEIFTVFGRVVDGTEVLDVIAAVETEENPFAPSDELSLPMEDVIIEAVTRIAP